jgi:DNA-binding NarL/FixJ family response regulator
MTLNKTDMIRLAIIDDHQVVVNGLKSMLAADPALLVEFTAQNSEELLAFLESAVPDVLLMDMQMPGLSGVDLAKKILRSYPGLKIIAFSSFDDSSLVKQVLRAGASGYLLKNADFQTIVKAIYSVMNGEQVIDEALRKILLQETLTGQRRSIYEVPITKREKEILKLVADGLSSQEIAEKLFISIRTVETHRQNLNQKLDIKNTAGLIREAIKRGLAE